MSLPLLRRGLHGLRGYLMMLKDMLHPEEPFVKVRNLIGIKDTVIYLGGITWGTKGGTQGNNVIMGWAIVINNVVNPYHVRDHK